MVVDIEQEKVKVIEFYCCYWKEFVVWNEGWVICNGIYYMMYELGKGIGFGGQVFLVCWFDVDKFLMCCNLFY